MRWRLFLSLVETKIGEEGLILSLLVKTRIRGGGGGLFLSLVETRIGRGGVLFLSLVETRIGEAGLILCLVEILG